VEDSCTKISSRYENRQDVLFVLNVGTTLPLTGETL